MKYFNMVEDIDLMIYNFYVYSMCSFAGIDVYLQPYGMDCWHPCIFLSVAV